MKKISTIRVLTFVFVSFLLVQTPLVFSSELNSPEKTLVILKDVVGLDMTTYNATLELHDQILDYRGLPQEDVKYFLTSEDSKLEVVCTFVNEKMRTMNIYTDGSPHITQQTDSTVKMANDFISRYQTLSDSSYYDMFLSLLDNVEENKNVTKTSENVKLTVTDTANYTSYRWIYTVNGIEAPSKCLALKFEKGFLKYFIDSWNLYTLGSTETNLSEEDAIKIAMDRTENHSWYVDVNVDGVDRRITVTEFTIAGVSETKLAFGNSATKNESRDGNPLMLFPVWRVKLYFDKLYPGSVYGVDVEIWADTGDVFSIRELLYLGDYSSNIDAEINGDSMGLYSNEEAEQPRSNTFSIVLLSLPIVALIVITIACSKRKQKFRAMRNGSQHRFSKIKSVILSIMLSFVLISLAVPITTPTVNADTYVMPLYGARCNGTITPAEESAAELVLDTWKIYFENYAGYTCHDYFGSATQRQTVLDNADSFEDTYDHVAMLHYGHGGLNPATGHYDYFDDDGWEDADNLIWDHAIYQETSSSKHFFVVLWSCWQGDIVYNGTDGEGVKGMPYAWFHGYPGNGDCFIGFTHASMPLTQVSANSTSGITYQLWLNMVGIRLSSSHATVIGALDDASNFWFDCDYNQMELCLGFTAYWDGFPSGPGQMRIYGNSGIQVW